MSRWRLAISAICNSLSAAADQYVAGMDASGYVVAIYRTSLANPMWLSCQGFQVELLYHRHGKVVIRWHRSRSGVSGGAL